MSKRFEKIKNVSMKNLTENTIDKLEQTVMPKQELITSINKLHRAEPYQLQHYTQPVIIRFKSHSFKEKFITDKKKSK